MKSLTKLLLLSGVLIAGTVGLRAQDSGTTDPTTQPPTVENPTPPELPDDIKALLEQFRTQRQTIVQTRREAIAKLKGATDEERAAILEELRATERELRESQRELARQIREELRQLREQRRQNRHGSTTPGS